MILLKGLIAWVVWLVALGTAWLPPETFPIKTTETRPELVVQTGHTSGVRTLAFSPDGRWVATGSLDKTVKLWDAPARRVLRTLSGHKDWVWSVAWSPDGRWLASGSADKTVKLWDVVTGQELRTLEGHTKHVGAVAWSPDGHWLASASEDKSVKIWDAMTGLELQTLVGHDATVETVAWSSDGRWLASGCRDDIIKIWDVRTGSELQTLMGHSDAVVALAFSPNRLWLASGSDDATVKVWDLASGKGRYTLRGHKDAVWDVVFSPDGTVLASGSRDETIKLWDAGTGREVRTLGGKGSPGRQAYPIYPPEKAIYAVAFSPDGRWLASGSPSGIVKLWDVLSGKFISTLGGREEDEIFAIAITPDNRSLVTASGHKQIKLDFWEFATGRKLARLDFSHHDWEAVSFSPDGRLLASGSTDKRIKLWDLARVRELATLAGHTNYIRAVPFSPDGRWLASASNDGTIKLWDVATRREVRTLLGHRGFVQALAFSSDGRSLASASFDRTVKIWDVSSGRELLTLARHTDSVFAVAFSPDGSLLASGGLDKTVKIWKVETRSELFSLAGHGAEVTCLAFSPDGDMLASGSDDNTIRLWNIRIGQELRTLVGHTQEIMSLAFSADKNWLFSGSRDGSSGVWDPKTGELIARLVTLREGTDWLIVTPDGLFDGSPRAWENILWRFGGNTFDVAPVEAFFNEFYYPGLLAEILAGKRPKAATGIEKKDRRQPQIQVAGVRGQGSGGGPSTNRNVTLKVNVAEGPADKDHPKGSGVRDVRLFRNGSLVKVWRGDLSLDKNGKAVLDARIPIVAGENRLTAYAFNHDNIKSSDTTLVVTGAESLKRTGTAYILAVGINQYANPDYNLNFAVADAQAIGEELRSQQANLGTFAEIEVIPLLDNDATKANILLALERLAGTSMGPLPPGAPAVLEKIRPAEPEDAVFIYFAGHGAALGPRFYLIPHDLGYTGKRTELDEAGSRLMQEHSISDLELVAAFEKVDAGELLLLIDACNSGQALEAEEKRRGPMNSKGLAQLAYEKGMYILTAAQGYQAALEVKELGHGLLTYALVEEGLKTPAADTQPKDGQVVVREWLDYATLRVPQLQEKKIDEAHNQGRALVFLEGEDTRGDPKRRSLQRPRVFYRREPEGRAAVIAKTLGTR